MSSRKESLKKSLGITEYPWSSDEDDDSTEAQTGQSTMPRRSAVEPRSSAADIPGTSGLQPHSASPASVRKHQAKMDRELFWSILNNTSNSRLPPVTRASSRLCDVPLSYVSRQSSLPASSLGESRGRPERPAPSSDVQRILAFKKLTHSLNSLSQSRSNNNVYSMSLRGSAGPSRSSLFTPSNSSSALSSSRAARSNSNRVVTQVRSPMPAYGRTSVVKGPSGVASSYRPRADPDELVAAAAVAAAAAPQIPDHVDVHHSDDEPVEITDPMPEPVDEDVNMEEVNAEESANNSSGGVCLEEEIVEVDVPDEPDADAPVHVDEDNDNEESGNNESPAVAANSETEALQPQQQNHGVKRKRDANDENGETYSVKAFNQVSVDCTSRVSTAGCDKKNNLLRLLECPVCLEWMEPPIAQCRRGHLVCARCRVRLVFCPVCRTTFSSVRNRAMEGVAEMLRYPCRHACGREVKLRRRAAHEASCPARRYHCPAPTCAAAHPLHRNHLAEHFQSKHLPILKIGTEHKFSMRVHSEQHNTWIIMALDEFFYLRVDVDLRTWGIIVYVAFMGPKCNAKHYVYEVSVEGQHSSRKLAYTRLVHSDLESPSMNVSRQDCFHLTLDQALNFLRFKNRRCEDKYLDFNVQIIKEETSSAAKDESDS